MPAASKSPWLVGAYNRAHRVLARVGYERDWFDESRVIERARARTGYSDFGSNDFRAPLRALLGSLARSKELSGFGRRSMRNYVIRALEKRLEIEHWLRRHPEILEQRIDRPVFIIGMPRTGSTHLHHLLAADPDVRT